MSVPAPVKPIPAPTPGPWEYVPSTEHHGPYIVSNVGGTICDFYMMSEPTMWSTANGGPSKPVHFYAEMADANAQLAAEAPMMLAALKALIKDYEAASGDAPEDEPTALRLARETVARAEAQS